MNLKQWYVPVINKERTITQRFIVPRAESAEAAERLVRWKEPEWDILWRVLVDEYGFEKKDIW